MKRNKRRKKEAEMLENPPPPKPTGPKSGSIKLYEEWLKAGKPSRKKKYEK